MHENMVAQRTDLSTLHFTKEFVGYEVESKWQLLTQSPLPFLLALQGEIGAQRLPDVGIARAMGQLNVGFRFFRYAFDFWGVESESGLVQVAMAACFPGRDLYQLAFKNGVYASLRGAEAMPNPPLVREESRTGKWISGSQMHQELARAAPDARFVGRLVREKSFVYITYLPSGRNFSVSGDICTTASGRILSQVELEYKGRNGVWLPDSCGYQLAADFAQLHSILAATHGAILIPTTLTKFNWLTNA